MTRSKGILWYGLKYFSAHIHPQGIPAVEKIAYFLKKKPIDYFVSSEYLRCVETADIISVIAKEEFDYDPALNSIFIETPRHFNNRIKQFVSSLERSHYENIAICSHGLVISLLIHHLTGKKVPLKDMLFHLKPGKIVVIRNGKVQKVVY